MNNYEPNEAEVLLIAALRSGKYTQARGSLRSGDSYCCLGVACDVLGSGEWRSTPYGRPLYTEGPGLDYASYLPESVADRLGWSSTRGDLLSGDGSLASHNDAGESFAQIADLIEQGAVAHKKG